MSIQTNLLQLMAARGETPITLANRARLSPITIRAWLRGARTPNAQNIRLLSKALDCSADDLLAVR